VHAAERAQKPNQHTAEEDTMNIETIELNAVAETENSSEPLEMLALSIDDLDLVGGGSSLGLIT
jgi:hypothetical protein